MPDPVPDEEEFPELRGAVRALCARFGAAYFRGIDQAGGYPDAFVAALTEAGWLAALIPPEYGGSGLGLAEASVIVEEVNRAGGNAGACHGQLYNMGTLLRYGSPGQKARWLPRIASGELRLQAMAVTEPGAGTDTARSRPRPCGAATATWCTGARSGPRGCAHSDLMVLLARTTPLAEVARKGDGLSLFLVDLREAVGNGLEARPIANMVHHDTSELFLDGLEVPAENLIGAEGQGFRHLLDGLNAERALIAAECVGDGRWFVAKAAAYARERRVFGRPIGQNQGVQFPIARAHVNIEAASLVRFEACHRFDAGLPCGAQANMAKLLAADASWEAANACLQTHGGYGFAVEYDVERKFRETRLYQVAPVSTNLILSYVAERVLGLPRSF